METGHDIEKHRRLLGSLGLLGSRLRSLLLRRSSLRLAGSGGRLRLRRSPQGLES